MGKGSLLKVWLFAWMLLFTVGWAAAEPGKDDERRWTISDVIEGELPFAIGHRGFGKNPWYDPDPEVPIENTTKAVRAGFRAGVQIVEVDANLTADGIAVSIHDDFLFLPNALLPECVNTLTFEQLKAILGDDNVKSLRSILQVSRTYSQVNDDRPSGQVVVEIKPPSPYCVALEKEPAYLEDLVGGVLDDIEFTRMEGQVLIESVSPEILGMLQLAWPEIPRILAVDFLQLLSPDLVLAVNGIVSITEIDKSYAGFDGLLHWGEIVVDLGSGFEFPLYRIPGYFDDPILNLVKTMQATSASGISIDKTMVLPGSGLGISPELLVELLRGAENRTVLVHTIRINTLEPEKFPEEWLQIKGAKVDGIFVDNIPEALILEASD